MDELVEYGVEPDRAQQVATLLLANADDPEAEVKTVTGGFRAPQAAWDAVMAELGGDAVEPGEDQAPADDKPRARRARKAAATNDS